jgi:hypothetical protein
MATLVTATNLQKIEFDVATPEGPSRVTIVTGVMPILLTASHNSIQNGSFKALVDPTLAPGKFRKATATVSLGAIILAPGQTSATHDLRIGDAQASLDDEAGQVQLVVDVTVRATVMNSLTQVSSLNFQVTTLAVV